MNGDLLLKKSIMFGKHIDDIKKKIDGGFHWYPYGSLSNFVHLKDIFNKRPIDSLVNNNSKRILDIGAADGDLSFYLESLGYRMDIIDYGPTNFNNLQGARLLKEKLNSSVEIYEMDIDSKFITPDEKYDLVFFLGILYHLKNPYYILEALSKISKHMILSTRVARFTPDGTPVSNSSLAYLLDADESNNDATNYWIFSDTGLRRIVDRCGWEMLEMITVGDTVASNPCDQEHDERAFAMLKSKYI